MSENDKKTSQEHGASDSWSNPKTAREAQQRKEAHRSNILYGAIAVLFVLAAITVFVWKSNVIQKNATAATINGEKYTAAEVSYYFTNIYQNFVSTNASYISYMGLDPNGDLKTQPYPGDETQSWFDYFTEQTMTQMSSIVALNAAAEADGYVWSDKMQTQFDGNTASLESGATSSGLSVGKYLQRIYGATMTKDVYDSEMKTVILASTYAEDHNTSLTYTDAQISAEYTANPKNYDVVDYESVQISGSVAAPTDADGNPVTDADGNPVEPSDEEKAAALNTAQTTAEAMLSSFKAGQKLEDLAGTHEYTYGKAGAYSESVLMNWLFDDARQPGDTAMLPDENSSAFHVVVFTDRYRQEYTTVDVRHVLIQPEAGKLAEGEEGYDAELAQLKADAKVKADELLSTWQSGEATEDSFATLANESSSDGGSNTNGGLYEQVYQGQMVPSFNDWSFDASRKTGDTAVVETDYGYHIMYFVGANLPYWQVQVTTALRNADYETWYADVIKDYTGEPVAAGLKYVG